MTLEQKQEFVDALIGSVGLELRTKLNRAPEDWDGHELRLWIASYFDSAARMSCIHGDRRRARRLAYENAVLVKNL